MAHSSPMTPSDFQAAAGVGDDQCARLAIFATILEKWQARINLVGRSTLRDVWRRHLLDSAQLLPLIPVETRVLIDLGSGAGFPGLVLAIALGSQTQVHLVESDLKKCAFLREVNRVTDAGAEIHSCRIESLEGIKAEVVTARALAPLTQLLGYAAPLIAPGGRALFLKGRTHAEELTEATKTWKMRHHLIPSLTDPTGAVISVEDPVLEQS